MMREWISGLGDQLRWAAALAVDEVPEAYEAIVCGMGGSGISGDYGARVAERHGRRVVVTRGYCLPTWANRTNPLVVAVSYSGNTEETLAVVEVAEAEGLPICAVTSGGQLRARADEQGWPTAIVPDGLQPRAAIGYLTGAVLRCLESAHLLPEQKPALEAAAKELELHLEAGGRADVDSRRLADALGERTAIIYGSEGPMATVATRWKTQINENGKLPAYALSLPEVNHNEIVGWTFSEVVQNLGVILLREEFEHPQVSRRFELTADLLRDREALVGEVWAAGEGVLAQMMTMTATGDVFSVVLAERRGTDPMPVSVIEELKERLE